MFFSYCKENYFTRESIVFDQSIKVYILSIPAVRWTAPRFGPSCWTAKRLFQAACSASGGEIRVAGNEVPMTVNKAVFLHT
jgi:hypothetical protein